MAIRFKRRSFLLWLPTIGAGGIALAAPPRKMSAPKNVPKPGGQGASPKPAVAAPTWALAFSPDSKTLAVGSYKRVLFYSIESGEKVAEWAVGSDAVRALAYSPDGKTLAAGGGVPGERGQIQLLDASDGKILRTITSHDDTVEALAFQGGQLLSAADDERIGVTDTVSGKPIASLTEHVGRCLSVAVPSPSVATPAGALFATGGADKMLKIWDADLRRVVVNFDQCGSPVWAVAPSPFPGQFVVGAGDGSVRVFQVNLVNDQKNPPAPGEPKPRSGNQIREMRGHEGAVYAVAADAKAIYSGGEDGKVIAWNWNNGKVREWTEAKADIWGLTLSSDGKWLAAASRDGKVRVYSAERGLLFWELPFTPPPGAITAPVALRGKGTGLTGTYFTNKTLAGDPFFARLDSRFDATFSGPQAPGMQPDNWSVRWEGFVEAPVSGPYSFVTRSDDGIRLWVNGLPLVDAWVDRGATEDTPARVVILKEGQRVPIKIEYFQGTGGAEMHLSWFYPGQVKQIVPPAFLYPERGQIQVKNITNDRENKCPAVGRSARAANTDRLRRSPGRGTRPRSRTIFVPAAALLLATSVHAQTPQIVGVFPAGARAGQTVEIALRGGQLQGARQLLVTGGFGVSAEVATGGKAPDEGLRPLVQSKCTSCHELRTPDNRTMGAEQWAQTVERMIAQRGAQLSAEEKGKVTDYLQAKARAGVVTAKITVAEGASPGPRELRLLTDAGVTTAYAFEVGERPEILAAEPNSKLAEPQKITLPVTINGTLASPAERDYFQFSAKQGETHRFDLKAFRISELTAGFFNPVLYLYDSSGREIAKNLGSADLDPRLSWTCPVDGEYMLLVRDLLWKGNPASIYRLSATVGELQTPSPPEPVAGADFAITATPDTINLAPGATAAILVRAIKREKLSASIALTASDLPPGVTALPAAIPPDDDKALVILTAAPDAPVGGRAFTITGKSMGEGRGLTREAQPIEIYRGPANGQRQRPRTLPGVAVSQSVPFTLETVSNCPVKANDKTEISVKVHRQGNFKGGIVVFPYALPWFTYPNTGAIYLPPEKDEVSFTIFGNGNGDHLVKRDKSLPPMRFSFVGIVAGINEQAYLSTAPVTVVPK